MSDIFRLQNDFSLHSEPKDSAPPTDPPVELLEGDKVEIVGNDIVEMLGSLKIAWVKVKSPKGEGFVDKSLLAPVITAQRPDEELPVEFRRKIALTLLAQHCFDVALDHGSNSSLLMALAFLMSGKNWDSQHASAPDAGDRVGIYGFTREKWRNAIETFGAAHGIQLTMITGSTQQCEVAALLTASHWQKLEFELGRDITAVELLLAFLAGPENAILCLKAASGSAVKSALPETGFAQLKVALASFSAPIALAEDTKIAGLMEILAVSMDHAFDFVRKFASDLLADSIPSAADSLSTAIDEMLEDDPVSGDDSELEAGETVDVEAELPDQGGGEIKLAEAHLIALWKRSLFPIDGRGIIVFGIRGCLPVDFSGTEFAKAHAIAFQNVDHREMRCTIGQWKPGQGLALFPGSTVPFTEIIKGGKSRGGKGVNQMGRGRHRNYVAGFHKRKEGKPRGHFALLQESDCTFQRTSNDLLYDKNDKWSSAPRPGNNIHCAFHMGSASVPKSRFSSAGCQVVAGTVKKGKRDSEAGPWKKFIAPFKAGGQNAAEYVLFGGDEVRLMIETRYEGKNVVLRFGSEGELVETLQKKLAAETGKPIKTNGVFGKDTFDALIDFQQKSFGPGADDGIVGPETAAKLGMTLPMFDFKLAVSGGAGLAIAGTGTGSATGPLPAGSEGSPAGGGLVSLGSPLRSDFIIAFAPRPSSSQKRARHDRYVKYLTSSDCMAVLEKFGIGLSELRLAHFLAQAAQETGGFTVSRESLDYRTVGAVRDAFTVRARNVSDAFIRANLLGNEEALGEWAYGDRLGNRPDTGDGFAFRGGGIFQTTGRENFEKLGRRIEAEFQMQANLGANPDLIEDPAISMRAACFEWDGLQANKLADRDEVKRISRGINRGDPNSPRKANGEDDRIAMLRKIKGVLGI